MTDPIDPEFADRMQTLAIFLDEQFNGPPGTPRQNGFVLLSFRFDDEGEQRTNYISNAVLADVIRLLRGFIPHAEKRLAADKLASGGPRKGRNLN